MKYLASIIGEPVLKVDVGNQRPGAVLTGKGFVVCDLEAFGTAGEMLDRSDPTERCEMKRGHVHIRIGLEESPPLINPHFGLNPKSGWLIIRPLQDLPPEARALFEELLPEEHGMREISIKPLQEVAAAYRADRRRALRLQDALAAAFLPSPVILRPSGLHSVPLRIYSPEHRRDLALPQGEKLSAIVLNWSGIEEEVRFRPWMESQAIPA